MKGKREARCWHIPSGMNRYDDALGNDQKWGTVVKIQVATQEDKEQLLKASEYIHNMRELDTDFMMVNTIAHLYTCPELIEVVG
jgi:hypothetical protein